jgi:hypothetical protein
LPVPLKEASIAAANTTLRKGATAPVTVTGKLVNGKSSSLAGAAIEYFSSNPDAVSVQDGVMTARQAGVAEVWAKVTWNGVTVQSNKITVEVPVELESVTLSADRYSLKRTETVSMSIYGQLNTGEAADLTNATVEFFSSNPGVISPQSVTSAVYDTGTSDLWVKVTLNGTAVESNKITITVTTDEVWIHHLLQIYESAGELGHPLAAQLTNKLDQAQHHKDKGHIDQGIKHLEDFLKHLHKDDMQKLISQPAKQALDSDVKALIKLWQQEASQS